MELSYLIWSAGLGFLYMSVQAGFLRRQIGIVDANSTRDDEPAPDLYTGRATRALRNFMETYPLFVALALAVIVQPDGSNGMTQWGCHIYVWGRLIYLPLYVAGISPLRSVVWTISAVGLGLIFVGALV